MSLLLLTGCTKLHLNHLHIRDVCRDGARCTSHAVADTLATLEVVCSISDSEWNASVLQTNNTNPQAMFRRADKRRCILVAQ